MQNDMETKRLKKADGTIAYYVLGKLHSVDGFALIPEGDEKRGEYYLFGIKHTHEKWLDKIKKSMNGVPYHKTAGAKGSRN